MPKVEVYCAFIICILSAFPSCIIKCEPCEPQSCNYAAIIEFDTLGMDAFALSDLDTIYIKRYKQDGKLSIAYQIGLSRGSTNSGSKWNRLHVREFQYSSMGESFYLYSTMEIEGRNKVDTLSHFINRYRLPDEHAKCDCGDCDLNSFRFNSKTVVWNGIPMLLSKN